MKGLVSSNGGNQIVQQSSFEFTCATQEEKDYDGEPIIDHFEFCLLTDQKQSDFIKLLKKLIFALS